MKIFKASEVKEIDDFTIKNEPIHSINLMERASEQISNWIFEQFEANQNIVVFIGPGNNGGDGLAISRLLYNQNYDVEVYILKITDNLSPDAEINLNRLKEETKVPVKYLTEDSELPFIPEDSVVIDALFGSGLTRPLTGFPATLVSHINQSLSFIIAVDIPSGLFGEDNSNNERDNIIKADVTLSFQFPNLSFFFAENSDFVGEFEILPIGLYPQIIEDKETKYFYIDEDYIPRKIKRRKKFEHKGNYGHALLVSGGYGKMGAAILASRACLRTGVGLLTVHIPQSGYEIIQASVPEAMVCIDESESSYCSKAELDKFSAIGIGPGIGMKKSVQDAVKDLITNSEVPLVLDADAINIIAKNMELLDELPKNSILTPHPKEFERIAGISKDSFSRNQLQIEMAQKYGIYIVLKGAHTAIACPNGDCYFNSSGNPGMASGGSGDVLTGIILSLLAQNYNPKDAAILGVYLHGLAGDLAADHVGEEALIASDIIDNLGFAFNEIKNT